MHIVLGGVKQKLLKLRVECISVFPLVGLNKDIKKDELSYFLLTCSVVTKSRKYKKNLELMTGNESKKDSLPLFLISR